MSASADPHQPHPRSYFRLGPGRPLATILLILAFLTACGLGFAAVLGTEVDVEPFVAETGPDRPDLESEGVVGSVPIGPALSVSALLSQVQPPSPPATTTGPTGTAPSIGDEEDQPGGTSVRFGPNDEGLLVVPEEWKILSRSEDVVTLGTGEGVTFAARIVRVTATTPATQLVGDAEAAIVASTRVAHLRTSIVLGLQPFGRLVTQSVMGYSALRTDAQGSTSVGGNIFAFVRDDDLALIVTPEVTPAAQWEERIEGWFPLWLSVVSAFAEGSPLA